MSVLRSRLLVPLLGAAVLGGVAAAPAQAASAPVPGRTGAQAGTAAAAAQAGRSLPRVCAGVDGCRRVARVDVDGDGRRDGVGIVVRGSVADGTVTTRVRTATGKLLSKTQHVSWSGDDPWWGAAYVDGVKGKELVVGATAGAHYLQFRVLTVRNGRLRFLWSPDRLPSGRRLWGIDGSYMSNIGVARHVVDGHVRLTVRTALRNASGTGHHGRTSRYEWTSDGWAELSTRRVRYAGDEPVYAFSGWHVRGLPNY